MNSEVRDALAVRRKEVILQYAQGIGNVKEACRDFNVSGSSFYRWKKVYAKEGKVGLTRKKPIAKSHPRQIPPEFLHGLEKILHLRTKYHLGPQRIAWYLELSLPLIPSALPSLRLREFYYCPSHLFRPHCNTCISPIAREIRPRKWCPPGAPTTSCWIIPS